MYKYATVEYMHQQSIIILAYNSNQSQLSVIYNSKDFVIVRNSSLFRLQSNGVGTSNYDEKQNFNNPKLQFNIDSHSASPQQDTAKAVLLGIM